MKITYKTIIKIILIILFIACLFKMPYGYFQLVRFVGMASFVWFAYIENERKDKTLFIIWILSALLINPFIKIALGRMIWNIVDVALAILLLTTILVDKKIADDQNRS